jgi:hypothetical protein
MISPDPISIYLLSPVDLVEEAFKKNPAQAIYFQGANDGPAADHSEN